MVWGGIPAPHPGHLHKGTIAEGTAMRSYAIVGELLLSDGTTYTRFAIYEASDMEAALRQAVAVVRQWRGERIAGHPDTTVRGIIEVQVGEDPAAS